MINNNKNTTAKKAINNKNDENINMLEINNNNKDYNSVNTFTFLIWNTSFMKNFWTKNQSSKLVVSSLIPYIPILQ